MNESNLLEIVVIGALIIIQLYITYKLYFEINNYKSIFSNLPTVDTILTTNELLNEGNLEMILLFEEDKDLNQERLNEISFLLSTEKHEVMDNIIKPINTYLIRNKGISIDFHILKDIVDRNVEILEDSIENNIPAPLYIGLAATMLGIIFGLFSVSFDTSTAGGSDLALQALKPLIDGVTTAMFASVTGLILTTVFSISIFKDAKFKVEKGKNALLSLLQSELMPKMNKSKLPEVAQLSQKLDIFSRNSKSLVSTLESIFANSRETIEREQELIQELKSLDVKKISLVNIDIFKKLEKMMLSFQNFAKYYEYLDKSLLNTTALVQNLERFVQQTSNTNLILDELKSIMRKSDQASEFFNQHIKSFSQYGESVNETIADSDSKMSRAIAALTISAENQFEAFNKSIAVYDSKLSNAFDNSIERFNESIKHQAEKTELAFNNARPSFEKLNKLDKLESIESKLLKLEEGLSDTIRQSNRELILALSSLKSNNVIPNSEEIMIEDNPSSMGSKLYTILKISTYLMIIALGIFVIYKEFWP